MVFKFNITSELLTLNEYIHIERANKFKASGVKKKFTNICALSAKKLPKEFNKDSLYSLVINWTVPNNKKDPDNIYFGVKFILDGLVNSGKLSNDTRRYIKNIHHNIKTDKKYNVEVILTEENAD